MIRITQNVITYIILILIIVFSFSCKENAVNNSGIPYTNDDDIILTKGRISDTILRVYGLRLSDMRLRYIASVGICYSNCYMGKIIAINFSQYCFRPNYLLNVMTGGYSEIPIGNYYPVHFSFSPDANKILFTTDGGNYLVVANADGTGMKELSQDMRGTETLAEFSRDGSMIAFMEKNINYKTILCTIDTSGNNKNVILDIEEPNSGDNLSWSPDNKSVVFANRTSAYKYNIFFINIDGTGYKNLTNSDWHQFRPEFSPDGLHVAYEELNASDYDIMMVNSDGSDIKNITNTPSENEHFPSWSPDGKKLMYQKTIDRGFIRYYIYDLSTHNSVYVDSIVSARWVYSR
jgi:Tol biopolymer transport system component